MSLRRAVQRLLAIGRSERLDTDLDGEIAAHLELAERDLIAAGLSPADARRVARQRFGGIEPIKEAHRDSRSARWIEGWWRDLRLGLRGLRRAPGFCAAAVLILGLSIGANTTMFGAVRAILLQPLGYADPDRLVVVLHDGRFPVAPANFLDWRAQTRSFEAMGAAEMWSPNLGLATGAERVKGLRLTPETLRMLGVAPVKGRLLATGGAEAAELRTVVIGHGLWQQRFGGAGDVVGRPLRLDGETYTVVGVMPPRFVFAPFWTTESELWAPLPLDARRDSRGGNSLRIFARLKPGVDAAAAQADVDVVTARLEQAFPGTNRRVKVVPLKERVVGHTRLGLSVLLVAVGFVLLIACANVAHMLLARAAARQSEIAVRLALGATRFQIVRQLLTESLLLAGLSSLVGLALAGIGVRVIAATAPPDLPRAADMAIEGWTLAFTLGLTILTGVVFGLVPAWQAARTRVGDRLAARGVAGHRREAFLRDVLVVSELALALVLLIGAGLMLRSLAAASAIDPGFEPRGLLSMSVSVQGSSAAGPGQRALFFPAAIEALRRLPGVEAASGVNHPPLVGDVWTRGFDIASRSRRPGDDRPGAVYRVVLPGYFSTMRLPIVHGRDVAADDTQQSPAVVVVSETLVRRNFPDGDALGQRITLDDPTAANPRWLTIVGVVRDAVSFTWEGGADPTHLSALPADGLVSRRRRGPQRLPDRSAAYGRRSRRARRRGAAGDLVGPSRRVGLRDHDADRRGRPRAGAPALPVGAARLVRGAGAVAVGGRDLRGHELRGGAADARDRAAPHPGGAARRGAPPDPVAGDAPAGHRGCARPRRGVAVSARTGDAALRRRAHRSADVRRGAGHSHPDGAGGQLSAGPPRRPGRPDGRHARRRLSRLHLIRD